LEFDLAMISSNALTSTNLRNIREIATVRFYLALRVESSAFLFFYHTMRTKNLVRSVDTVLGDVFTFFP